MTTLSIDALTLGVPDVGAAKAFYTTGFALPVLADHEQFVSLGLGPHAGTLGLYAVDALAADAQTAADGTGFRGYTISYLVEQPAAVDLILDRATTAGAQVIKPAKKSMWGGYSAVVQAPDGALWKLATPQKKGEPVADIPEPTDVAVLIGVADVKRSKAFYEAVGMTVGKSFGGKYVDFASADGADTLALYRREALAEDAGVPPAGEGFQAMVLYRIAETPAQVDGILEAGAAHGGEVAVKPKRAEPGGYAGHLADPDGFLWKVACG